MAKTTKPAVKSKQFPFSEISKNIDGITKTLNIHVEKEEVVTEYISTGVMILNASISGSIFQGIPSNRITIFAGEEATGKTFLALNICREAQKKGYSVIYIDTEYSIDKNSLKKYGIDSSEEHFKLIRSNKIEMLNMMLNQILAVLRERHNEGYEIGKIIFVLDSVGQLISNKESTDLIAGNMKSDMTKAKALGLLFRSLTADLGELGIPFVVNNQVYQSMDMFPQTIMRGGKSGYYSGSTIMFLSKAKLKTGDETENDIGSSGIIVTAKAFKNRLCKPKKVKFEISIETGCNPYKGLDIFFTAENFKNIGIAKGKMVVDKETGEMLFTEGGNRWYVEHLNKHVSNSDLFTKEVFTKKVLDEIDKIAKDYFRYRGHEELMDEYSKIKASSGKDELQETDLSDVDGADLFN